MRWAFTMSMVSCFDYQWSSAMFAMINQVSQELLSTQLWPQWRSKWLFCSHFHSTKNEQNLKLLTLEESQSEISKNHQIHWIFSVSFKTSPIIKPSKWVLCSDEEEKRGRRRGKGRKMSWSWTVHDRLIHTPFVTLSIKQFQVNLSSPGRCCIWAGFDGYGGKM